MKWLKWIALPWLVLLVASCMPHPWFKTRWPWEDPPDPNQKPVLTNSAGEIYEAGMPTWALLVDDCMRRGRTRRDCIDSLPPEELEKYREWERRWRRR